MFSPSSPDRDSADLLQLQYQASGTIYGSQNPAEILEALASLVQASYTHAELLLVDFTDPDQFFLLARRDPTGVYTVREPRPLSDYPATDAVAAVELLSIPDVAADKLLDEREKARLQAQGVGAMVLVPMVTNQVLIGLLVLWSAAPAQASAARLRALRNLADQAAVVFENQRLLQTAQAAAERLARQVNTLSMLNRLSLRLAQYTEEQPLLDFVAQQLAKTADIDHIGIVLIEPDGVFGRLVSEYPVTGALGSRLSMQDNPLLKLALRDPERPFIVEDAAHTPALPEDTRTLFAQIGIASLMIVPLVVNNEVIGSMGFDLYAADKAFSEEAIEMARLVGTQMAINLQNIRLLNSTRQRADELAQIARNEALLNQIGVRYQEVLSVDELLRVTLEELGQALGADSASIRLGVDERVLEAGQ